MNNFIGSSNDGRNDMYSFDQYQKDHKKTDKTNNQGTEDVGMPVPQYIYAALGMAGEAGEVADEAKKSLRYPERGKLTPERVAKIIEEMGDVLWYIAKMCEELGIKMETVAQANLTKLEKRYADRGGYKQ
jgi:NTP pyrophosphatase (non-canonical NTP hydrolase)